MMNISRKQLVGLFICNLSVLIIGNGLTPLLPVYAESLGADSFGAGLYLAVTQVALAAGALSASWVSGSRLRLKLPLILGNILAVSVELALGRVTSLFALTLLTSLLWFLGGMGMALTMILTGLSAGDDERGRVFGVIGMTFGLGAVIGGLATGWLVREWGYPTMFSALSVSSSLGIVAALFLEEKEEHKSKLKDDQPPVITPLGWYYFLLFSAGILISISGFLSSLIRSLSMNTLGFDALEISSTGVIGGLISLPLPFLLGWLSDRFDRKKVLIFGYFSMIIALLLLAFSRQLWHFWLVAIISAIHIGSNGSAGNALVTDLIPRPSFGKGLALFGAAAWIGGMLGYTLGGLLLQKLTFAMCCYIGMIIILVAIGLLIPIQVGGGLISQQQDEAAN